MRKTHFQPAQCVLGWIVAGASQSPSQVERTQKREARREKQRKENPLRAKKMRALRIEWKCTHEHQIAHNRAPAVQSPPRSLKPSLSPKGHVFIGCSGWFYWHWRGNFYPQDLPTAKW